MKKKKTKKSYRLRNWKQYNSALVTRGSLTFWVSDDVLNCWLNSQHSGNRGKPRLYTDTAIVCCAMLKEIYHLPLRATQGLLISIFKLMEISLAVPDFSTLSRRLKQLEIELPCRKKSEPLHLVVDSTGVKIFGEGEWKVRLHGYSKRRSWRKLHLGADESSGEIVAAVVTTNSTADNEVIEDLLDQVEGNIEQVSGDGSYDKRNCYKAIEARSARAAIPPRKNARIWQHGNSKKEKHARDQNLRRIRKVGRKEWKKEANYHRRSLVETAVFRLKMIFGEKVSAREFERQAAQMLIRCAALNRMTHLGMPDSYGV